jgi:2'-5' RNA ligase
MSKVYSSAVVIIPPHEKWEPIQEIRIKYDRQINRWMPHITLLYPFKPEDEYQKLESSFSKLCSEITPFEVSLKKFHYFKHKRQKYTLWLKPEPVNLVKDLQTNILQLVPDCNDVNKYNNGFNPHLSVGQIQGNSKLVEILGSLQDNWNELKFPLNEIFFISREKSKTSKFEIKRRFKLLI